MAKNNDNINDRLSVYREKQSLKAKDMLLKKNNWFYVALLLISLVTLMVAWLIESNTEGVETKAFDGFDIKYVYVILATMVLIGVLNTIGDYIIIYKKQKIRKFKSVVGSVMTRNYYQLSQISLCNAEALNAEYLTSCGVEKDIARNMSANKTLASKIALVVYSLILIVIGTIFTIKSTNILLYIFAILSFLIIFALVLTVLYFDKYKAKYLKFLGAFCKFLYKCKLIKDYEKLYNNLLAKLMYYGLSIKFDKMYLVVQIVCGFITRFLKHILLFFILSAFNYVSWSLFVEVLFKCMILDLLLEIIPTPSGLLCYEILFLTLFRNTFVFGYVLYGMVGYRIITYFIVGVAFAVGYFIGIRKRLKSIKNK